MNYNEAMEYIEKCAGYGIVPGLDSIRELLRRLGNPQEQLRFVHIAGTNGKGSVLAFVSTMLTANGYKVGRFVSPTIFEYRERFQMQGKPISKAETARLMETVAVHADAMAEEGLPHPTPFEIETAMAFLLFAQKKCDIVVLETGMGGTLDATNVIENTLVSVITPVSYDHMGYLGDTLEEIAGNKAGIIKQNAMVVSAPQEEEAAQIIREAAEAKNAESLVFVNSKDIRQIKYGVTKQSFTYKEFSKLEISLAGSYQIMNAVLAVQVILCLQEKGFVFKEAKLRKALRETLWPGRFQVVDKKPLFIVDGAHNEAAAKELRKSIEFYFTNKRIIYIMGVFRDKEYRKVIENTYDLAESVITVAAKGNPRALPALELANTVAKYHKQVTAADSIEEAVELSYLLADKDTVILAFGSLAYLGDCIRAVEHRKEMGMDTHGK